MRVRTKIVTFRATDAEVDELARIAAENGLPMASMIRCAVGTFVADYREEEQIPEFLNWRRILGVNSPTN